MMKTSHMSPLSDQNSDLRVLICFMLILTLGCNSAAEDSIGKKTERKPHEIGMVVLTPEEIRSGDIVVRPVVRGEFKVHRDFSATCLLYTSDAAAERSSVDL